MTQGLSRRPVPLLRQRHPRKTSGFGSSSPQCVYVSFSLPSNYRLFPQHSPPLRMNSGFPVCLGWFCVRSFVDSLPPYERWSGSSLRSATCHSGDHGSFCTRQRNLWWGDKYEYAHRGQDCTRFGRRRYPISHKHHPGRSCLLARTWSLCRIFRAVRPCLRPLRLRLIPLSLFSSTWCLAASVGPVIGGSLAAQGKWRWLFCMSDTDAHNQDKDVLITVIRPQPSHCTRRVSLSRALLGPTDSPWHLSGQTGTHGLDVGLSHRNRCIETDRCFADRGNCLVISSTVAYTVGLTWGGTIAPWGSTTVLVPLALGFVVFVSFMVYEAIIATYPLVRDFLAFSFGAAFMAHVGSASADDKRNQYQRVCGFFQWLSSLRFTPTPLDTFRHSPPPSTH